MEICNADGGFRFLSHDAVSYNVFYVVIKLLPNFTTLICLSYISLIFDKI